MKRKKSKNSQTEWVQCTRDSRDAVIMYVPNLDTIPVENNYRHIMQKEIKNNADIRHLKSTK